MKVKNVHIQNFKRFTDLTIEGIPEIAKMVVLVGPNGCGKTSVFEAFNYWQYNNFSSGITQIKGPIQQKYLLKQLAAHNLLDDKKRLYMLMQNIIINCYNLSTNFKCYFRTAYRNQAIMDVNSLSLENLGQRQSTLLIENDERVSFNYTKLIYQTLSGVYAERNNDKTIKVLRDELIGKIQKAMKNIFGDLILNNIHYPLEEGSFYFQKGIVDNYHYNNLSSGEKAVFDLLLDLIVNLDDYQDSLFFIDEPEAHIHTKLQGQVIEEIYNLIPDNSQLWITTHSLGVMTKAKELSIQHLGSVVFLDFDGHDFDQPVTIKPSSISSTVWQKFMSVALDGIEKQLMTEITIMCEGGSNDPKKITVSMAKENEENNDFDSVIYNKIFNKDYPTITFESVGSCNNLERDIIFTIMSKMLKEKSKIYRLRDKDDATPQEIEDYAAKGMLVTSRRNIEGYLLDDELLENLIDQEVSNENNERVTASTRDKILAKILKVKADSHQKHVTDGKPKDDFKKVAGDVFTNVKTHVGLSDAGNSPKAFLRDVMASLITPDTKIYQEIKREIIQPILGKAGIKDMSRH